jgi:hypothetical protein
MHALSYGDLVKKDSISWGNAYSKSCSPDPN